MKKLDFNFNETNRSSVDELKFEVSKEVANTIEKSRASIATLIDSVRLFVLEFEAYGKNFPKSQKISPDAYVQTVLQLAFYRAHGRLGNAYESGSLRKYSLGRTDVIRSCSSDAMRFVRAMSDANTSSQERSSLFLKAINAHRQFTNSVLNCESFDRHLLGLKLIAFENNIEVPELYNDSSYKSLCHYLLSSSQISSKFEAITVYGPAVHDGYGNINHIIQYINARFILFK